MAKGPCDPQRAVGLFEIQRAADYTAVSGEVAAAVPPSRRRTVVAEQGACMLLRRDNAFCDPPCASEMVCVRDGQCLPIPAKVDVGTVSVHGLTQPVRMEPKSNNQYFDTTLPAAALEEGAALRLEAGGGAGPPFTVQASGVGLLELSEAGETIAGDRDFRIAWSPGRVPARVLVQINVDQHGNTPVTLACDLQDSAQVTLAASLVARLLSFGVSGFPSLTVTRQVADSTQLPSGCVGLHVFSTVTRALKVLGHTPCRRDADCPTGSRCDLGAETCH